MSSCISFSPCQVMLKMAYWFSRGITHTETTLPAWVHTGRYPGVSQEVRQVMGYALYLAQMREKHPDAKSLKGFGGAGVLEVVDDHAGDTYRAVYTVKCADVVYVLHAFQKKSRRGRATSKRDMDLIKARLQWAQEHSTTWRKEQ